MNRMDIVNAIDIHKFFDRLEEASDVQNYYQINHLSPEQREKIALKMAETLTIELKSMGLHIDE